MLPPLRRPRRLVSLSRIAGLFSKGVRSINETIEPVAQHWDAHNAEALHEDGPLWVALGDSVTQGIGASSPATSYAGLVLDELIEHTGRPWRLINLSMTGARFADVIDHQLPAMVDAGLSPEVVTAIVGSNDLIWRRDTDGIITDAHRLVEALPAGTILSRVSEARADEKRLGVNRVFDAAAAVGRVQLFEAWDWPTGQGMWAADRFHPNDKAHRVLADNTWQAMRVSLGV